MKKRKSMMITMLMLMAVVASFAINKNVITNNSCKSKPSLQRAGDDFYNGSLQSILFINKAK